MAFTPPRKTSPSPPFDNALRPLHNIGITKIIFKREAADISKESPQSQDQTKLKAKIKPLTHPTLICYPLHTSERE